MPLCESTALFLQKAQLTLCFHAHGDDGKLQISRISPGRFFSAVNWSALLPQAARLCYNDSIVNRRTERWPFSSELIMLRILRRNGL